METRSTLWGTLLLLTMALLALIIVGGASISYLKPRGSGYPVLREYPSPLGDLSRFNMTLECELPRVPETAPRLRVKRMPVTREMAQLIASEAFRFEEIEGFDDMPAGGLVVKYRNKRLEFFGLENLVYYESNYMPVVRSWTEDEVKAIAEEFLAKLDERWLVPTEVELVVESVGPCWESVYSGGVTTIHAIGVRYASSLHGSALCGPGVGYFLAIAEGRVIEAKLHKPVFSIEGSLKITVSPQEAVEKLISGMSAGNALGFDTDYGPVPREGDLTITSVELAYYVDFLSDPPQTYPPLIYQIRGSITGPSPHPELLGEKWTIDFNEYVFATN